MKSHNKPYTELDVWKETRILVKEVYLITKNFPKEEQYGIINQIQRSAISIPSNVAEGCGRNSPKDSLQFFYIARGSLYELETQLILSFDLLYLNQEQLNQSLHLIEKCKKLLNGFIRYYRSFLDSSRNLDDQRITNNE